MLYTEKEKHEIERVKEVFAEHLRQSPDFELLWSDKVGYVWLAIGVNRCDCFNRSFLCSAVLPDVFFRLAGSE